jgi:hypothetical protein
MRYAQRLFWIAAASTLLYELTISSPWWSGNRQGGYEILFKLTVPSLILVLFAYYSLQKKRELFAVGLPIYLVFLQIAIMFTVYVTIAGLLP